MKTPISETCAAVKSLISRKDSHVLLMRQACREKEAAHEREKSEYQKMWLVSRELQAALEKVARKYLRSKDFKLIDYHVRDNHFGRNHVVVHTDSPFISNESVNIPLEVLDWTEEQWVTHGNSSETLDPTEIRLAKLRGSVDSLELALERAKNNYEAAKSAIATKQVFNSDNQ